jgi:hypothetical protein
MLALSARVSVLALAVELPARVSVQLTAPELLSEGALHAAVTPEGRPEAMLMVDPPAPLAAAAPPAGVAVTVNVVEASDCMDADAGDSASVKPGGGAT